MNKERCITVIKENLKLLDRNLNYYDNEMSQDPKWLDDRLKRLDAMKENINVVHRTLSELYLRELNTKEES